MASATSSAGAGKADDGVKFTITVQCNIGGEKRAVSYTVFKRTLMSQVFDSSVQFFKLDPSQVILIVKNKVALTHKCVEDYRLSDKSVLDLIHLKEAPTIELTLRDQAGNSKTLTASTFHPLSDVVKAFCKHLGEETGFSDLYHGGIALDLDASPASIGLKTGEQLFCYCYKAACKQHWISVGKPEQAKSLRFIKFYFSDWKYGYKTFPIFRHDISTPMEVLIKTFCAWRGLDYEQTGFLYSYTYKQVQQGDTATNKALADGDTILAYSRQELQGRLWDSILAGSCQQVLDLLDQGAELSTSIGPEEWGKHPLHAAVANGHVELVRLLLQGSPGTAQAAAVAEGCGDGSGSVGGGARVSPTSGGGSGVGGGSGAAAGGARVSQAEARAGAAMAGVPSRGPSSAAAAAAVAAAQLEGRTGAVACSGDNSGGRCTSTSSKSSSSGGGGGGGGPRAGGSSGGGAGGALGAVSSGGFGTAGGFSLLGAGGVGSGCDPNQLDYASDPPLWHAVENNLVDLVELLLAAGATAADVPSREGRPKAGTGYSACPHAARKGHAETLRVLLATGANPWLPDADGYTAYDYALDHAKPPAVVAALLEGDPRFAEMQRSFQAAYQRMCQMLKRTQRYPALGCPCRTCNSLLEIRAPETEASKLVREQIGCVALVRAVQAGGPHCIEVMELLLKHGALLDGQDYDGRTALHQAIRYNRLAEAAWLTSKGAHLDIPDFEGLLPLHQAGCSGFCDITRLLVNAGAPLNLHTIKYVSQEALDAQAKKQAEGHLGSKKAKRKQQLDVSGLTTIGGNSPLALAIRHGHGAIVEYLLSQNAVFDLKNAADSSAFHAALDKGSAAIAGLLLQHINKKAGAGVGSGGGGGGGAVGRSAAGGTRAGMVREGKDRDGTRPGKRDQKREAAVREPREKEREGRERERDRDKDCDAAASGGGSGSGGSDGSEGGNAEGTAAAAAVAPPTPPAEPPVAFDAGAGLREMVLRERERLRQQLGLSTPGSSSSNSSVSNGAGSAAVASESKPVLSIFSRNGTTMAAASRAAMAPVVPASVPLPPAPKPAAGVLRSVAPSQAVSSCGNVSGSDVAAAAGGTGNDSSSSGGTNAGAGNGVSGGAIEEKCSGSSVGACSSASGSGSSVHGGGSSGSSSTSSAGDSTRPGTAPASGSSRGNSPMLASSAPPKGSQKDGEGQAPELGQQRLKQQQGQGKLATAAPPEPETVASSAASAGPHAAATLAAMAAADGAEQSRGVENGVRGGGGGGGAPSEPVGHMAAEHSSSRASDGKSSGVAANPSLESPEPPASGGAATRPLRPQAQANGSRVLPAAAEEAACTQPQADQLQPQAPAPGSAKAGVAPAAASGPAPTPAAAPFVLSLADSASPAPAAPSVTPAAKSAMREPPPQPPKPQGKAAAVVAPSVAAAASKGAAAAAGKAPPPAALASAEAATKPTTNGVVASSVMSPIKIKFRAKPVDPLPLPLTAPLAQPSAQASATEVVPASGPTQPTPAVAHMSAPSTESIGVSYTKTRRGKVITVTVPIAPNRYRAAGSEPQYSQQQQQLTTQQEPNQGRGGGAGSGSGSGASDAGVSSAAPYLTIPASLLSGGSGVAARHQAGRGGGGGSGAAAAAVAATTSGLRPAAPSYSPRGMVMPPSASVGSGAATATAALPTPLLSLPSRPTEPAPLSGPPPPPAGSLSNPLGAYLHRSHAHLHGHLSGLPPAAAVPASPMPPPGFGSAGGRPPLPLPGLTALAHVPGSASSGMAVDAGMADLESTVLSVVDQGLEESVGVRALGDTLLLDADDGGGGLQHTASGSMGAMHGGAAADGLWPTPAEVAAAAAGLLPSGGTATDAPSLLVPGSGIPPPPPPDQLVPGAAAPPGLLLSEAAAGLRRAAPGAVAPPGAVLGISLGDVAGGGAGQFRGGGGAAAAAAGVAMVRAHSGEVVALGGLVERNGPLAPPPPNGVGVRTSSSAANGAAATGAAVAIAAAGAVLDGGCDAAPGGCGGSSSLLSRTTSHQALSRYDSGALQASHAAPLALFSDVWSAEGGKAAVAAGGAGAGSVGGLDGGGTEWRGSQADAWAAYAEAQQLQLSQAMEAFGGTAAAAPARAAPSPPASLEPLPDFPASLFDDDDQVNNDDDCGQLGQQQRARHHQPDRRGSGATGRDQDHDGPGGGAPGLMGLAPGGRGGPPGPHGSVVTGGSNPAGSRPGSSAGVTGPAPAAAGVEAQQPQLPQGGNRPMLFPPGAGPGKVGAMGPMGGPTPMPYTHGPGVMYPPGPMGPHAPAPFGGGHAGYGPACAGPYGDWYGGGGPGPFGGYRSPQPPMLVPPGGGMYGNPAAGAGMPGPRGGGGVGPPGMAAAHGTAGAAAGSGSFSGAAHAHTHAGQAQQQGGAVAGPGSGSVWFTGGGGKAAAMSGMAARASSGTSDATLAAAGAGNSSGGSGGRLGHGRGGKGRR